MELDFGPAEPPSQPPTNPPPDTPPQPPQPPGPPSPDAPQPLPPAPPGPVTPAAAAPTQAHPVKSKGKGRKVLLVVGIIIVVAGLGYLGYTLLAGGGQTTTPAPTEELIGTEQTSTLPETLTTTPEPTTTLTPTPTTASTGATSTLGTTPAVSETVSTRDAIRKKDLATIQTYLESYFNAKGSYPASATLAKLNDATNPVVTALVPTYTSSLPRDPKDPSFFYGYKSAGGSGYTLTAQLENTADPEGKQSGSVFLYSVTK